MENKFHLECAPWVLVPSAAWGIAFGRTLRLQPRSSVCVGNGGAASGLLSVRPVPGGVRSPGVSVDSPGLALWLRDCW